MYRGGDKSMKKQKANSGKMKKRNKIIITIIPIAIFIIAIFIIPIDKQYSPFETYGNNEHFYKDYKEWEVVCDVSLIGISLNCQVLDPDGNIALWPEKDGISPYVNEK